MCRNIMNIRSHSGLGPIISGSNCSVRLGRRVSHLRKLGKETTLALAPEEQYLVAKGRTYFQDFSFDDLGKGGCWQHAKNHTDKYRDSGSKWQLPLSRSEQPEHVESLRIRDLAQTRAIF
jgi:hypothetical protein